MKEKITGKMRKKLFAQEFIKDLNATQAAKRVGFSIKTAYSQGQRLLKNVEVQALIQKAMDERAKRTEITQDKIVNELAIIAFSDLQNYLDINGDTGAIQAKGFDEMLENSSRALKSIKEDRVIKEDAGGSKTTVYDKVRFELHDKIKALELLGRHLGMFNEEAKALGEVIYQLSEKFMPNKND